MPNTFLKGQLCNEAAQLQNCRARSAGFMHFNAPVGKCLPNLEHGVRFLLLLLLLLLLAFIAVASTVNSCHCGYCQPNAAIIYLAGTPCMHLLPTVPACHEGREVRQSVQMFPAKIGSLDPHSWMSGMGGRAGSHAP